MRTARSAARLELQDSAGDAHRRVSRNHVNVVRLHRQTVRSLLHPYRGRLGENSSEIALVLRVEMLDQDECHAGVSRQLSEQQAGGLEPTGGRADTHYRKRGALRRIRR